MSATPDHPESEPVPAAEDAVSLTAEHVVPEVYDPSHHTSHHASASDLHVAPSEPHPLKLNPWQRWMAWSGSFFVLSLLVHVLLIGGATILVVQVVAGRKEKLKFTAPPPSSAGPKTVEHKVKLSKATASAPSVSKRITSTAANASIALPAMEMSSSSGPDVMASVMSGLGTGSLGVGAAAGGGSAGGASMPAGGLTAFGYKGATTPGLKVNLYDLKQQPDGTSTDIGQDFSKGAAAEKLCDYKMEVDVQAFMEAKWDPQILAKKYYKAKDTITAYQFHIFKNCGKDGGYGGMAQSEVLKAFGAESNVKPGYFIIHYTGRVSAPKTTTYHFGPTGIYAIRFDEKNIWCEAPPENVKKLFPNGTNLDFKTTVGRTYPIDILVVFGPSRGGYNQVLTITDMARKEPYPKNPFKENRRGDFLTPLFQVKLGLPLPEYIPPDWSKKPPNALNTWVPYEPNGPKFEEAIVFPAQK